MNMPAGGTPDKNQRPAPRKPKLPTSTALGTQAPYFPTVYKHSVREQSAMLTDVDLRRTSQALYRRRRTARGTRAGPGAPGPTSVARQPNWKGRLAG